VQADLVFVNGVVHPLGGSKAVASGLAVAWNRIAAVGDSAEMRDWIGSRTRIIDLGGRVLLPGFNEAHCHVFVYGQSKRLWRNLRPDIVHSLDDVLAIVRDEARRLPMERWIRGRGFDPARLPPRFEITRADLDAAAPHHPVCLTRLGGHVIVGNSRALALAGITRDTTDPPGGKLDRDPGGEPTGVLREAAQALLYDVIPPPTLEETKTCLSHAAQDYLAAGITSVQNAGTVALDLEGFQHLYREGELPLRVYLMVKVELLDHLIAAGIHTGFGDDFLRVGPLKIFLDGGIGAHTAALDEPYRDDPENRGILWLEQESLDRLVARAHRAGFQIATHAIGDRAIRSVLDAYERALVQWPRENHRHRIEHCELCTGDLLDRVARLDVIAVPQPIFLAEMGHTYLVSLGEARAHRIFPLRTLLDAQVPLAGSSDSPVSSYRPLDGIQAAITRRAASGDTLGPGEELAVRQALHIYTTGGAYASFEEGTKGALIPGYLADLVVLDRDPLQVPPGELSTIEVDMTIVDGEVRYEK